MEQLLRLGIRPSRDHFIGNVTRGDINVKRYYD